MKTRNLILQVIVILVIVITAFIGGVYYNKRSYESDNNMNDSIVHKLERIEQLLNKNASIQAVNDSIDIKVITVEKVYEKTINNIINSTPDDNYAFFAAYIKRYYSYLDSIKNSKSDIR